VERGRLAGHRDALIPLAEIRPDEDRSDVGGKAAALAALSHAGFSVPAAFVVPVAAFRNASRQSTVPDDLQRAWIDAARALGSRLAVRSSAVDEDGARRSYAGQNATLLGVAPEDVPDAVRTCWGSLDAPRARAYRGGSDPPSAGMAVIVQVLIDAAVSGIVFTINPMTGSWREMVVEAVFGLGEGVTAGHIAPHWFLVRRPAPLPGPLRRIAERVRLEVIREDRPPQTEEMRAGSGGVERIARPIGTHGRSTVDRPALRRLCRLALDVERTMGAPQDIEWARTLDGGFVLLQARPITTTAPLRRGDEVVWTRRFVGERWPDPVSPLGWSIVEPVLSWFVAWPETQDRHLGGGPPFALFHGRPYVNATVFRHLAFKLPGARPPSFMVELVPPDEAEAWRRSFAVAPDPSVYASLLATAWRERRWRRFAANPFTNRAAWKRYRERLDAALPSLAVRGVTPPEELVRRVEVHTELLRDYVGIHLCTLLYATLAWQLLDAAVAAWIPDRPDLRDALTASPPGNLTVETNTALHALAALATAEDLETLAARRPLPDGPFARALARFLDQYGHRSDQSWEILSARWRRRPDRIAPLLEAARADTSGPSPAARAALREDAFQDAMRDVRATLSRPRRATVELLARAARRTLLLRENQRFSLDRLFASLQDQLLALGEHACAAGVLDSADDVAFVTWPELQETVRGTLGSADVHRRIAARRKQQEIDRAARAPTFLRGDAALLEPTADSRWAGTGISPGRARGRVRVLTDVTEGDRFRPGEILVAHALDPGTTPLLRTAGAVVLEMGSMLSHGAIVAREYGVPAVVNIEDATQRLADGAEITVDGGRGVVWVHDAAGSQPAAAAHSRRGRP
jgi:pyruvate,water dikinase